jgi:hypothetical protein
MVKIDGAICDYKNVGFGYVGYRGDHMYYSPRAGI